MLNNTKVHIQKQSPRNQKDELKKMNRSKNKPKAVKQRTITTRELMYGEKSGK